MGTPGYGLWAGDDTAASAPESVRRASSCVFKRTSLSLVGVAVFHGEPYYQSYLIVPASDGDTCGYADRQGKVFTHVEPRSNTGYLYPRYVISKLGTDSNTWFRETFSPGPIRTLCVQWRIG